jgi:hypothetical protein
MRTGTKSLLFGVHQIFWHPFTVWLAWIWLYRKIPSFKETICIIIHDWGYWGKNNMDDTEGQRHPEFAARIALKFLGEKYRRLCLYHSRHYAKDNNATPSKLCWADKMSIIFDPWWLYLPRAWLSGELKEYREISSHLFNRDKSHFEWYHFIKSYLIKIGKEQRGDACVYMKNKVGE